MYASSFIAGPDMWDPQGSYITEFVKDTKGVIDAVTWHQYYLNGQTAQEEDFLKPDVFDYLASRIQTVKDITNSVDASSTPIWLGETSSAYRGGAANMSDTFLATFLWADKLGVSAKMGLDVVMRQTLFNDNYALIDHNYDPNPDWWFSVIYKKLVGTKVVPYTSTLSAEVRLYSHCAAAGGSTASVAVFGVNLASSTANVRIEGLFADENSVATIYAYELTADPLLSRTVYLNGEALHLTEDYDLPELVPKEISSGSSVTMPPYSIVFWVIPSTDVNACL
ncbi:hypothetical protein NQ318_015763 [Aromia moschata]|uniref:Heparanase n=1 Tax=Aromia moschata TaxID=1265417 RepID=A0AAV8XPG7_9CUCU|nr:hypothetical protein NQ318_015763 [Aromia moschata]